MRLMDESVGVIPRKQWRDAKKIIRRRKQGVLGFRQKTCGNRPSIILACSQNAGLFGRTFPECNPECLSDCYNRCDAGERSRFHI